MNRLKPVRFPKDSGVTMEGFENIRIPSRERAGQQFQTFVNSALNSRSVTMRTILGSWGEGKTETYNRFLLPYCKTKNFACFFVSASTIANIYSYSRTSSLIESSPVPAIRFVAALLSAIRAEKTKAGSIDPEQIIPNPDTSIEANDFIRKAFEKMKSFRRIFVFIDEFEELLLREELKHIISGLKELINGQLPDVDEGGEFEGLLHLVVGCTPEAFFYLQTSRDTEQIFGSLVRRQDIIELSQISKSEGMNFLWGLLQYCYESEYPSMIPISSFGIFEVLLRIGQRNLGVLVSLFSRMLQENFSEDQENSSIDGESLLEFLRGRSVPVYGSTKCVEEEIYENIRDTIRKHAPNELRGLCWQLMKIMVGEPKPFSYKEISNRIGTSREKAKEVIEILTKVIERHSRIRNAIVKVNKLKYGVRESEILDKLSRFKVKENEKEYIQMDQYMQNLIQFIDNLTFYELKNPEPHPCLFFPQEKKDIAAFFPGIGSEISEEVLRRIGNLKENETLFIISEDILSAIYPSPIPLGLEYITDKKERIRIWNDIGKHLNEYYEQYMNKAIFSLINISEQITLQTKEGFRENIAEISAIGIGKVTGLVWTCSGHVTEREIVDISDFIRKSEVPIHLVLLFYTGSITNLAKEEMVNVGLVEGNYSKILDIRLHPMLSKRILSHYLSRNGKLDYILISKKPVIDDDQYNKTAESLLDELKFLYRIVEWERVQEKRGLIIIDLTTEHGTPGNVAGSLKHFLNFPDEMDFSDVFKKNQDTVRRFVRYGTRDAPLADIESEEELKKLGNDLIRNGMLEKKDRKFLTPLHPVERYILNILDLSTAIRIDDLEEMFIRKSRFKRVFRDVFLNTLRARGQIRTKGETIERTSPENILEDFDKHKENLERLWGKEEITKFGIFYEEKKRDFHSFTATEFKEFTKELIDFIEKYRLTSDPEIESNLYRKIILLVEIIDHFQEKIFPLFSKSFRKASSNKTKLYTMFAPLENEFLNLISLSDKWLAIKIEKNKIEDWKKLEKLKNQIENVTNQEIDIESSIDFLSKIEQNNNPFFFKNDENKAYFFNPKLFFLENLMEEYKNEASRLQKVIEDINLILGSMENQKDQLLSKLRMPDISEKLPISYEIMKYLRNVSLKENIQEIKTEKIQLSRILEIAKNSKREFDEFFELHISSANKFKEFKEIENEFQNIYENKIKSFYTTEIKMNSPELQSIFEEERVNFDQVQKNYVALQEYTAPSSLSEIPEYIEKLGRKVKELIRQIKENHTRIESEWEIRITSIINNLEQNILILEALISTDKAGEMDELIPRMKRLKENIAGKKIHESPYDMKTLKKQFEELLKEFTDVLGSTLSENQRFVLLSVIKSCKKSGQAFISLKKIYKIAKKEGIGSDQTKEIINYLIGKNLIEAWISPPQSKWEDGGRSNEIK